MVLLEPVPDNVAQSSPQGGTGRWLAIGGLAGLALGVLSGSLAASMHASNTAPWLRGADALVLAFTNAFRLIVPPLVVSQLYLAIAERPVDKQGAVKLGFVVPGVFVGLLLFTALVTLLVTRGLLGLPWLQGLSLANTLPVSPLAGGVGVPLGGDSSWVNEVVPPNLVGAAASDNILPLMLFTLAFALAARRLAPELQGALGRGFAAVRGATFVLVDWVMQLAPIVLFALAFRSAFDSGFTIGGVLLAYTVLALIVHAVATLALYPVGVLIGRVPLGTLARAAYGPQLIAATTRSSLATIPSLLVAAENVLRIPSAIGALVIPIGGATLKLSRAVSSPAKFLFLAQVLGLHLGLEQVVVFTATIILLSPSTAGVPRVMGGTRSLPAYVSAGIPPQYVILLSATNAITDFLMTVLNTTGYLIAAVLVGRLAPGSIPAPATDPVIGDQARHRAAADMAHQ